MKKNLLGYSLVFAVLAALAAGLFLQPSGPVKPDIPSAGNSKASAESKALTGVKQTKTKVAAALPQTSNSASSSSPAISDDRHSTLLITRDFGKQTLFYKSVACPPESNVMDILQGNLQVKTRWGGAFVESINGLGGSGGDRQDWFYYINGLCCDTGAKDYKPANGDSIWWDYHAWNMGPSNAAVIGLYPEPFVHGFQGRVKETIIMSNNSALAGSLKQSMHKKGVRQITVRELNESLISKRNAPTIVIGIWNELEKLSFLSNLNQAYGKNGTGMHFAASGVELLDHNGRAVRTISGSAGVIAATSNGLADDSPLWLISGTDQEGLELALNTLLCQPQAISNKYNSVIVPGEVIGLPVS